MLWFFISSHPRMAAPAAGGGAEEAVGKSRNEMGAFMGFQLNVSKATWETSWETSMFTKWNIT